MKKVIEITEDVEKHLIALMHVALKSAGADILSSVDFIRNSIKTVQDQKPEVPVVD